MNEYAEERTVVLRALTSTSKLPNGYPKIGSGVIHIVIDGFSGCEIADTFGLKRQQEVIYLPGSTLKITKVATANDGNPLIFAKEVYRGEMERKDGESHGRD